MDLVYCSFDVFPSPKGAAVHIEAFARALGRAFGAVDLLTMAATPATTTTPWLQPPARSDLGDGVVHHAVAVTGADPIARALSFRTQLEAWWGSRRAQVVHVRSIFEGLPIALHKERRCQRLVYEVNGLPSIELKYHYPQVAEDRELMRKLEAQEQLCLQAADLVITPSPVTAAELGRRGAAAERLEVIPNGVDEQQFSYREPSYEGGRALRLLYVGTMTTWQGVHHALEALRLLLRDHPAELVLVGPARGRQRRDLATRCARLGVERQVSYLGSASQAALVEHYRWADVALVPLPANDRNVVQGCCPLKLLEAMAAGVPIVASDLPVVRALVEPEQQALLVRPGSGKAIKDGLLRLVADPRLGRRLAASARRRIESELTWHHASARLVDCYRRLL